MLARIFIMLLCFFYVQPSVAAPVDWGGKAYSHFSNQEPLSEMLKTLASTRDIPISVSPQVTEVVSMHYKERLPAEIFNDLVKNYGLIWFFDGETLYVYKESEAQRGSVSLKKMSPQAFTAALKRLNVLDKQYHWEVSEVDNMIYFTGPERFVTSVLDMAKLMDTKTSDRPQIYKWVDASGRINYSNERPMDTMDVSKDVSTKERFPGFDVVDVVNR